MVDHGRQKARNGRCAFRVTVRAGENAFDLLPCSQTNLSLLKFIMRVPIRGSALRTQALSFKFHQPLSISDAGILPRILIEGIALRNFATLYAYHHKTIVG